MITGHEIFSIAYWVCLFFSIGIMTYSEINTNYVIKVKTFSLFVFLGLIPVINMIISGVLLIEFIASRISDVGEIVLYRKRDKD